LCDSYHNLGRTAEEQRLKAETLCNILDTVNANVVEAFSRLDAQNLPVPPNAETIYNEGIAHAEEAVNLISHENIMKRAPKLLRQCRTSRRP
jgi:hypothetical protein